jgi:hypothetical protein
MRNAAFWFPLRCLDPVVAAVSEKVRVTYSLGVVHMNAALASSQKSSSLGFHTVIFGDRDGDPDAACFYCFLFESYSI